MKMLVLGGTQFLSHAVAAHAVTAGHEVVCAARGVSGAVPDGAELVVWDRDTPAPTELLVPRFDAVVDVGRLPSHVSAGVDAFSNAHWVFVSTINVYDDIGTPAGRPGTLPLHQPLFDESSDDEDAYGRLKVACEQIVRAGTPSATVIRPGLIIGPGDPSGRFTYWPERFALVGDEPVLAPGSPTDVVQVIDVRDLAAWIVSCAEQRRDEDLDGVGPQRPMGDVLERVATAVGVKPRLIWTTDAVLQEAGVQPWMGPESVPLWLPRPEYDGMLAHNADAPAFAGLMTRPIEDTARDTLAWLRATPDATVTGISRERELEVLSRPSPGVGLSSAAQ